MKHNSSTFIAPPRPETQDRPPSKLSVSVLENEKPRKIENLIRQSANKNVGILAQRKPTNRVTSSRG